MARSPTAQTAGTVALAGVALFWVGLVVGGLLAPDYSPREDYISALAARGSSVAAIGIAAIAALGLAHVAAGVAAQAAWRAHALALFLVLAGVAGVVVASARMSCASGAAGCGITITSGKDWIATTHGWAIAFYEVFGVLATAVVALGLVGNRRGRLPRWLRVTSAVLGVASLLLVSRLGEPHTGLWQRLWVTVNSSGLVLITLFVMSTASRPETQLAVEDPALSRRRQ